MMKRLTLVLIAFFAIFALRAQLPDNWTGDTDIETFQETTIVFAGDNSCGVIVNSGTQANCDLSNAVIIPVTAGDSYTVNFWGNTSVAVRGRAVFLWEGASATYSNEYLGPDTGGWMEFLSEGVVPEGATGVRLGIRFYDVSGFTPGEVQYIDDITFESPTGTALVVANGDFESWPGINPEPTEYPTEFMATAAGLNAVLSWMDPANGQLPENYLIKASKQDNITNPNDGTFVPDDLNLSDGSGAVNVGFGEETFTFPNLEAQTMYYFKIFPYSNSGTSIDYKNDGTPPSAQAEISNVVIIEAENFDASWGNWTPVSVLGDEVWGRENTYGINSTPCAQMTGYNGGATYPNEDWLISPSMDFTAYQNETFSFYSAVGYITADAQFVVRISTDYDGGGDPTSATWTDLDPILPDGGTNWVWTASGTLDVSGFESDNVHIAFVYSCDNVDAATWEVDEILISGEGEIVVVPEPTNYPSAFSAMATGTTISLTWADATGETIPTGYLILGSDQDNIALPEDGMPVADDASLNDGSAAINIMPGAQAASFSGLASGVTYYFKAFPYTNTGSLIDYKTDGTPPSAMATTAISSDILFTDFNDSWGGWTPVSLVGDQTWRRDNTYGLESTPCALMSGFSGSALENEDWLISPALNLSATTSEVVRFYSSTSYDGPALQFLISSDYNGTGNPNDFTWTDLSDAVTWSPGSFEWTLSGDIDISMYAESNVYIAFVYFSTTSGAANWEIDNVQVMQAEAVGEPTNYPTAYTVTAANQTVSASWTDATGEVIPEGYVVMISDQTEITLPEDGTPVANDNDYSDGNGALNVMPGTQSATFSGLMESTMYYTVIIPYTNSGTLINYKTDGIPPTGSATTGEAAPDILFTTFNESWENWTAISVTGDQIWDRDNSYGLEGTPCARMSGYSGEAFDNEDWLISPAIDLAGTNNQTLSFYSASAYDGPALEVLISTDYDGSGNPNDFTWDNLTAQANWPASGSFFEFTSSELINIEAYAEQTIFVAFKFTSTTAGSAPWEVDNIRVQGDPSSIGEYQNTLSISLYPNPGNGMLHFNAEESVNSIQVFNLIGMKVYELNTSGFNGQIDLTALENGIYMVRFAADEKVVTRRIIIQ